MAEAAGPRGAEDSTLQSARLLSVDSGGETEAQLKTLNDVIDTLTKMRSELGAQNSHMVERMEVIEQALAAIQVALVQQADDVADAAARARQ